jgi:hypothetical protein
MSSLIDIGFEGELQNIVDVFVVKEAAKKKEKKHKGLRRVAGGAAIGGAGLGTLGALIGTGVSRGRIGRNLASEVGLAGGSGALATAAKYTPIPVLAALGGVEGAALGGTSSLVYHAAKRPSDWRKKSGMKTAGVAGEVASLAYIGAHVPIGYMGHLAGKREHREGKKAPKWGVGKTVGSLILSPYGAYQTGKSIGHNYEDYHKAALKKEKKAAADKKDLVNSALAELQRRMNVLLKEKHNEPSDATVRGMYVEKTAAPAWLKRLTQRAGKWAPKSRGGRALLGTGAALTAGAGTYGVHRGGRKRRRRRSALLPTSATTAFAGSIPAKIKSSRIFKTLVRRASRKFPDVPRSKIEKLVYQAMKERGVLNKISSARPGSLYASTEITGHMKSGQ